MSNQATYKGLGALRRETKFLSTAGETLSYDDQAFLLAVPAGLNGAEYVLPQPNEVGIEFEFIFLGDAATNENIIRGSSGDYDMLVGGTTAKGAQAGSTSEGNEWVKFRSVSATRYVQMGGLAPWVTVTS